MREADVTSVGGLLSEDIPMQGQPDLGLFEMMEQGKLDEIDADVK